MHEIAITTETAGSYRTHRREGGAMSINAVMPVLRPGKPCVTAWPSGDAVAVTTPVISPVFPSTPPNWRGAPSRGRRASGRRLSPWHVRASSAGRTLPQACACVVRQAVHFPQACACVPCAYRFPRPHAVRLAPPCPRFSLVLGLPFPCRGVLFV